MRATRTPIKVTFTGIMNESQLSDITITADKTKCKWETMDCSTKCVVTGTTTQIERFVDQYNA